MIEEGRSHWIEVEDKCKEKGAILVTSDMTASIADSGSICLPLYWRSRLESTRGSKVVDQKE